MEKKYVVYKNNEYPVDENGDILINNKLYTAQEVVDLGKGTWKQDPQAATSGSMSSSSSHKPYGIDYSSSRRAEANPITFNNIDRDVKSNPVSHAADMLLFPLGSAIGDIADVMPDGGFKDFLGGIGMGARGIDMGLNVASIKGIGAPVKAATVAGAAGTKGVTKVIPNALREGTKFLFKPESTLNQISKGKITGKAAADRAVHTDVVYEKNLINAAADLSEKLKFRQREMQKIARKGAAATPAEKIKWKELYEIQTKENRELGNITSKLGDIGKKINNNPLGNLNDAIMQKPFIPEAAAAAGEIGQRAALIGGLNKGFSLANEQFGLIPRITGKETIADSIDDYIKHKYPKADKTASKAKGRP
jgi:hypothetical protein